MDKLAVRVAKVMSPVSSETWTHNIDIMRQAACVAVNPITVDRYGFLFNCTTGGGGGGVRPQT